MTNPDSSSDYLMDSVYDTVGSGDSGFATFMDYLICFCAFYGLWKIFWWVIGWLSFLSHHCCRLSCQSKTRTFDRHGIAGKSWAVVTGGSDGIGLAMCHKLAKEGFNICIVARNESKMQGCLQDIQDKCPNVQTMYVIADFGQLTSMQDYKETIAEKLKDLDVAVLVANAGYGPKVMFEDMNQETLATTISLNVLHVAYLIRAMSDQLLQRKADTGKKAALVVVSSVAANFDGGIYSSTKAFATNLAVSLSFTMAELVDVLAYEPAFVETKMVKDHDAALVISPERAADVCFRDLGLMRKSKGDLKHYMMYGMFNMIPEWLMAIAQKNAVKKARALAAEEEKQKLLQ